MTACPSRGVQKFAKIAPSLDKVQPATVIKMSERWQKFYCRVAAEYWHQIGRKYSDMQYAQFIKVKFDCWTNDNHHHRDNDLWLITRWTNDNHPGTCTWTECSFPSLPAHYCLERRYHLTFGNYNSNNIIILLTIIIKIWNENKCILTFRNYNWNLN